MEMMQDIRAHITDYSDREKISDYLEKLLDKEADELYNN